MKFRVAIFSALISACTHASERLVRQDDIAKVYHRSSLIPHGTGVSTLEVYGKKYPHANGARMKYVQIPGRNLIVFTTKREGHRATLHVISTRPVGPAWSLDIGETSFGTGLGYPRDYSAADYVERVDGERVYFVSKFGINFEVQHGLVSMEALIRCFVCMSFSRSVV